MLMTFVLKWLVCGRLQPGAYPLWSRTYLRWWFQYQLLRATLGDINQFLADTCAMSWFYTLLGARIGKRVRFNCQTPICEPDLLVIGDDVLVGRKAFIYGSG